MWASWNMYRTVSVTLVDILYEPLSNEYISKVDIKHVRENRKDNYEHRQHWTQDTERRQTNQKLKREPSRTPPKTNTSSCCL